jgi:myo-inositol-1(or 4)-monophosphatase
MTNIREFLAFGNHLADNSRKISLKYFKKKLNISSKSMNRFNPVTIADTSVQSYINTTINKKYPDHSIIGEESSLIQNSIYEWCIDPIDGTKSFITGFPTWGTLISLSINGKIVLGIADFPALNERYVGYDKISYKLVNNRKKILKVKSSILSRAILSSTSTYAFKNKNDKNIFEKISKKIKNVHLGGDCYQYCLLADGYIDIVLESGLNSYDIRALIPIVKNSGGSIKTWNGENPKDGGKIIATSSRKLLSIVQSLIIK